MKEWLLKLFPGKGQGFQNPEKMGKWHDEGPILAPAWQNNVYFPASWAKFPSSMTDFTSYSTEKNFHSIPTACVSVFGFKGSEFSQR